MCGSSQIPWWIRAVVAACQWLRTKIAKIPLMWPNISTTDREKTKACTVSAFNKAGTCR